MKTKKSLLTKVALTVAPLITIGCSTLPLKIIPYEQYDKNELIKKDIYVDSLQLKKNVHLFYKNFK